MAISPRIGSLCFTLNLLALWGPIWGGLPKRERHCYISLARGPEPAIVHACGY